jgi:hypothetical protein
MSEEDVVKKVGGVISAGDQLLAGVLQILDDHESLSALERVAIDFYEADPKDLGIEEDSHRALKILIGLGLARIEEAARDRKKEGDDSAT